MAEFRGIEDGFFKNIACEEMTISNTELFFPKYIGGYDISGNKGGVGSIVFNMNKKPNWFHRLCTKLFLGWDWIDMK